MSLSSPSSPVQQNDEFDVTMNDSADISEEELKFSVSDGGIDDAIIAMSYILVTRPLPDAGLWGYMNTEQLINKETVKDETRDIIRARVLFDLVKTDDRFSEG